MIFSKNEIAKFWNKHNYRKLTGFLNVYYRNLHKFQKGKTDNLMDYSKNKNSFFRWQWNIMQEDIINYYN